MDMARIPLRFGLDIRADGDSLLEFTSLSLDKKKWYSSCSYFDGLFPMYNGVMLASFPFTCIFSTYVQFYLVMTLDNTNTIYVLDFYLPRQRLR